MTDAATAVRKMCFTCWLERYIEYIQYICCHVCDFYHYHWSRGTHMI